MNRFWVVLIFAGLIFWQSSCLEFRDGMIINRCGLWQKVTGGAVVLAMREPRDRVQEVIRVVPVETPMAQSKPPEGSSSVCINAPGGFCSNNGTVTQQIYPAPQSLSLQYMPSQLPPVIMATPNSIQFYGAVSSMAGSPGGYYESYRNGRYR